MPSSCAFFLLQIGRATSVGRRVATLLLGLLLAFAAQPAYAQFRAGRPMAALVEAHNETATPSLSRHVRDVQRITAYLADVLRLSTAQQLALQHCTVAERADLLLATTDAEAQAAHARYLAAVRQVLVSSQLRSYLLLRQQLEGTLLPLDGLGLSPGMAAL